MPNNIQDVFILRMPAGRTIPPRIIIDDIDSSQRVGAGDEFTIPFRYSVGYPKLPVTTPFVVSWTSTPPGSVPTNTRIIPPVTFHAANTSPTEELDGTLEAVAPESGYGDDGVLTLNGVISVPGAQASFSIVIQEIAGLLTITPEYTPQEVLPGDEFEMPFTYRLGDPKAEGDFEVSYESTPGNYACTNNRFDPRAPQHRVNGQDVMPEQELGATLTANAPELRHDETQNRIIITGTITMRQPER